MARIIPKNNADQKPLTAKPSTIASAKSTISAFITNKNKPKVKTVIGIVRNVNIGFKVALKSARKIATTKAEKNPSTFAPGKR